MTRADTIYLAGFRAALGVARTTADRIAACNMPTLRKEMAAEALRSFADEAERTLSDDAAGPAPSAQQQAAE